MVDLFMYRDPDQKKTVAAEEPVEEEGEAEQEGAVADAVKTYEGEEDDGDEGDEKWGAGNATTTTGFAK